MESELKDNGLSSEFADRSRPRNSVYSLQGKKLQGSPSQYFLRSPHKPFAHTRTGTSGPCEQSCSEKGGKTVSLSLSNQ